ncbi:26S proteasome regulatory subunit [Dunaliella salina]|uniref:26S proteasome regulatory subunit n=1 Tax=Dunaliella salina TaxID=3046 RepID=A0ABQ7G763_DUNSA|nr:26S proteasome regulatory subunit [Dunaliella salina]|eukprot:KAF5830452.1 26S proteasome regulatory subunit [Dunaliella salina]
MDIKAMDVPSLRKTILQTEGDVAGVPEREAAITRLCELLVEKQDAQALAELLSQLRGFFGAIPKAKTAKIVRNIIDSIAKVPGSTQLLVDVCKEQVEWAKVEKRAFLRQRIELRLASLYLDNKDFQASLALISTVLSEVKKLDDKLLLVDIHLLESRCHHMLRNTPKARAALTAARTAANAIYVPVQLQAEIDSQSGTLAADEKDQKTAFSYFFEAFEQFSALNEPKALPMLKYMLLCKIMMNDAHEVPAIINSKAGLKYTGRHVDAMKLVAKAYQDRSLQEFQDVLNQYPDELAGDTIINHHLSALYDTLLEQNLMRLIEPFSRAEIAHIAKLIALPADRVESKLSQMILDKKLRGTLDQGAGSLEIFDVSPPDNVYPTSLEVFESLGRVVDTLFSRSQKIVAV